MLSLKLINVSKRGPSCTMAGLYIDRLTPYPHQISDKLLCITIWAHITGGNFHRFQRSLAVPVYVLALTLKKWQ